jgi:P4 family phage/plasmid primase-like protien
LALEQFSEARVVDHALASAEHVFAALPTLNRPRVMLYDGTRWTRDSFDVLYSEFLPAVIEDVQDTILANIRAGMYDDRTAKAAEAFATRLNSTNVRKTIDEALRRMLLSYGPGFAEKSAESDEARWLFNVQNGTLDLRTNTLKPHSPGDFITQLAPVEYKPGVRAEEFERMVERILPDADVRSYVQELLGYALNGHMRASIFPIFYGLGANGKSTLLNAVRTIMGSDYAGVVSGYVLETQGANRRHPVERMIFKGRRLIMATETGEGMRLDETAVKEYTSTEPIAARALYADFEEFSPSHTIIMQTNHAPKVAGGDEGIWRRLREVPFTVEIPEHERDADLGQKLESEASGILNWLLEGHARWFNRGQRFDEPAAVRRATDAYKSESNPLSVFVSDHFVLSPELETPSATIYDKYKVWAEREGYTHKFTKNDLIRTMRRQYGLESYRRADVRGLKGIGLRGNDPPPDNQGRGPVTPHDWQPSAQYMAEVAVGEKAEPPYTPEQLDDPDGAYARDEIDAAAYDDIVMNHMAPTDVDALMQRTPKGRDDALALANAHETLDTTGRHVQDIYVDLETTGLHPIDDKVRLLVIKQGDNPTEVFDMFDAQQRDYALRMLEGNAGATFVAHFAQFDLAMLEGNYGYVHRGPVFCTNVASKIKHAGDTPEAAPPMTTGYTKAGNPKLKKDTPHSLRSVAYRELGILIDKAEQLSDWSQPELTDEQIDYAQADVDVLPRIAAPLRDAIADVGTVDLDMQNVKIAARLAVRGVRFDVNAWTSLATPHVEAIERIDRELDALAEAEGMGVGEHNWNSVPQKSRLLDMRGVNLPDTRADTLKLYQGDDEAVRLLVERAEHTKRATTYGEGFLKDVDRHGRIRSTYGVYGAATGRFSSSGPNLQNIPREAEYRACFVPDEGMKFVIADWSQIEVRYIAAMSEDMELRAALETGDVYVETARKILGVDKPTKEQRQLAKAVVLGFQYGLGVDKFRNYAETKFGVKMTDTTARMYRDAFFAAYPTLRKWQRETGDPDDPQDFDVVGTRKITTSRTYLGRKRAMIDLYTERINTPIQAAGADALKLALAELHDADVDIVLHVHDEIVVQAAPEVAERVAEFVEDVMLWAAQEAIDPDYRVPVPVEVAIGDSWADKA